LFHIILADSTDLKTHSVLFGQKSCFDFVLYHLVALCNFSWRL